jgi:hypothetical protein
VCVHFYEMPPRREINVLDDLKTGMKAKPRRTNDDGSVGRTLWAWRRELLLTSAVLVPTATLILSEDLLARPASALLLALLIWQRDRARSWRRRGAIRRAWAAALITCGLQYPTRRHGARIDGEPETVPVGDRFSVRFGRGLSAKALQARAPELAAALRVDDVRITKVSGDASRAAVVLVRNDPFADYIKDRHGRDVIRPLPWPLRGESKLDLWDPVLLGLDENGDDGDVVLPDHSFILGGEPGAGKSVALNIICATGALDPTVHLWLFAPSWTSGTRS